MELNRTSTSEFLDVNRLGFRLQADMTADVWLAKNIRPLSLIAVTASVFLLAFYTTFSGELSDTQIESMKTWVPFCTTLMMTIYAFYFGSRGLEKLRNKTNNERKDRENHTAD